MTSVASGGTTDRILTRIVFKVVRAGSGTPARYSSMLFGASLVFSAALRRAGLAGFTKAFFTEGNEENEEKPAERLLNAFLIPARIAPHARKQLFYSKAAKATKDDLCLESLMLSVKDCSFDAPRSLLRFARGTQVLAVLMQHHSDYLTGRIAFEIQLGVHDLVEELVGCAGVDRKGWLAGELCLKLGIL
jgi:hypothetical protein